jgi:hypothetical protein
MGLGPFLGGGGEQHWNACKCHPSGGKACVWGFLRFPATSPELPPSPFTSSDRPPSSS